MASLILRLFGHPGVELDGHPVFLETRKALAILTYLALSPQPVSREYLATLFWPEFSQSRALANLRRNLSSLTTCLKEKVLEADWKSVFIKDPLVLNIDVRNFRQKMEEVRNHSHYKLDTCEECQLTLEEGIQVYRGEFLQGFNLRDCPEFDNWQYQQRQDLQQDLRWVLNSHIRQCVARRMWEKAIRSAHHLVALDPLDETSQRKLMWLYAQGNQRKAALHQYEEYLQILQKELDQDPEPETVELFQDIRDGNIIRLAGLQELLTSAPGSKLGEPIPSPMQQGSQLFDSVLHTKLFIPPVRKDAVNRPRLIEKINQGVQGALTLVSAPAGFGKTTLLASWAAQFSSPIGWVSLEADDNVPVRFMAYLILGLKSIEPKIGELSLEMLAYPRVPPFQTILTPLLNEISRMSAEFVIVFDDYHAITSEQVQKVMSFLIDHLCPNLHLVIATRSDPLLPLARLRARNQLADLRVEDLRFSEDEVEEFLNREMGLNLSPQDIAVIGERTEGWVVGLQMAALSMSSREDKTGFIQAFSGSHHYVLDYLVDEVISRQSPLIQTFLLETSILERLSGSLCNTLTGNYNGQEMLELLEKLNLFLMPLDDEHHWYRYHQLFAGLLRGRFQFSQPALFTTLHERASGWFEHNGYLNYSIYHSIEAKDYARSANLIEKVMQEKLNFNGPEIITWIDQIPEELVYKKSFLSLAKALYFNNKFQQDATSQWLQAAEEHALTGYTSEESNIILGMVNTLRAVMATIRGELPDAIDKASTACKYLTDKFLRLDALGIIGETYYLSGNIQGAIRQWDEIEDISRNAKNTNGIIEVFNVKARALVQLGKLREEERVFRAIFQLAAEKGIQKSHVALARLWYGDLLREWNELDQGEDQILEGLSFFSEDVRPDNLCRGYIFLAFISLARGDLSQAKKACQRAEQICSQISLYPDIVAMYYICKIRLCVAGGDLPGADQVLQECLASPLSRHDLLKEWILIAKARLQIAQGRVEEAADLLAKLAGNAQTAGRTRNWIEILNLQAMAYALRGQSRDALGVLGESLLVAEPEGFIQLLVSEGETLRLLLQKFRSEIDAGNLRVEKRGRLPIYVNKLLVAFSPVYKWVSKESNSSQLNLPEPLTARELEILQLLCTGLSNQEIAEKLFITNSTVKSHIHHIFNKIEVESRTQLIIRAKELNLI